MRCDPLAEDARARLAKIEGLADLQVEKQVRIPQLEIMVDYTRAALYGLQPQAITEQLERLSNGRVVSRLFDGIAALRRRAAAQRQPTHDATASATC